MHQMNGTLHLKFAWVLILVLQTVCGMSVVGSDWEKLKRFNLAELYQPSSKGAAAKAEAMPQSVMTDEAPPNTTSTGPSSTDP